ncbi:MAG: hypothetical protein ACTSRG_16015 [Candidatus Helarchaeota archaeon]
MRKKIIIVCLFLGICSILLLLNCIRQPSNDFSNFGMLLNNKSQKVESSDTGPFPYEPPDALVNLRVERTVFFRQSLTYVNDYFIVKNNKTNPKDFIQVGLVYGLRNQLYSISANTKSKEVIRVQELPYDGSGFYKWNLYLSTPILPQSTYNFTLTMIFGDVIDFDNFAGYGGSNNPKYNFYFYKYPSSPYYSEYVEGQFANADDFTPYSTTNLPPWSFQSHSGTVTMTAAVIECEVFQRQIQIDRWGYLYVREYYQLKNLVDILKPSTFSVLVPADALNIEVYDFFTQLIVTKIPDPLHLSYNLTINWELSRHPIGKNQIAYFYVDYRRPIELHQFEAGNIARFLYQFDQALPWKVNDFITTFQLPSGSSILTQVPTASSVLSINGQLYLNYQYNNATNQNYHIYMFDYSVLDTLPFDFSRPLVIAGLISIPLISLIILSRELPRKKELRLRPTEVPSHIIREFITLYSEKNALYLGIEKLEEDLSRRKIKKREYRNQLKNIERKLSDLNKEMKKFQDEINEAGGRYAKIIEELELREADRDMSREALEAIERRYRISRRISTTTYRKLKKEEEKALSKAKNSIDKLIQELRELMG